MSLLLCRQKAAEPYCFDKLNIKLWSEQELSYCIFNYPLLCLKGFIDEKLIVWIESGLKLPVLSAKLRQDRRMREPAENMLLRILQDCNYYSPGEVTAFGKRLSDLRRMKDYELKRQEGRLLYGAGRLPMAYDSFSDAIRLMGDESPAVKADIYCDLAVIRLRQFDEAGALELLMKSELTAKNSRAVRMRYLVNGAGDLPEQTRQALDEEKAKAVEAVRGSEAYKKISGLFEKDDVKVLAEAAKIVNSWKNTYRKM